MLSKILRTLRQWERKFFQGYMGLILGGAMVIASWYIIPEVSPIVSWLYFAMGIMMIITNLVVLFEKWTIRPLVSIVARVKITQNSRQYASDKYLKSSTRSTIFNSIAVVVAIPAFGVVSHQKLIVYVGAAWIGIMLVDLLLLYIRIKLGLFGFNRYEAIQFVRFLLADMNKDKTPPGSRLMRFGADDLVRAIEEIPDAVPEFGESSSINRAGVRT